jgi:5-bromo-4-chloroindolyl phosphate hydrolysis protein
MRQAFMMWEKGNMMGNYYGGGHLNWLTLIITAIVIVLAIKIVAGIFIMRRQGRNEVKETDHTADYKAAGLSDTDIQIFRETLSEAKKNIKDWEDLVKRFTDLSVIEDVTGGLSAAKKIFQYIVQNPSALTKQDDFLYKKLPNIKKLSETFAELMKDTVKSENDSNETLLLIKTLSASIAEDYHTLLMKDVKVIGSEIQNG